LKRPKKETVCEWMDTTPDKPKPDSIIGLAINDSLGKGIINGLRHPKEGSSNGWYIWSGEFSESADFFSPICYEHLKNHLDTTIIEFLDLPPGYRFLVNGKDYEDVWFDETLLNFS